MPEKTLTIYKYTFPFTDEVIITMPRGAKVLSFGNQNEKPALWALVDPTEEMVNHLFRFAGTGHPIAYPPEALSFVGTAHFAGGAIVFHLFEILDV